MRAKGEVPAEDTEKDPHGLCHALVAMIRDVGNMLGAQEKPRGIYWIANDCPGGGAGITITYQEWKNTENVHMILEAFKEATEALDIGYIVLPLIPCIMSVLNSHIEVKISTIDSDRTCANACEAILLDRNDHRDEFPNVVKITTALRARMNGLEALGAPDKALWRGGVLCGLEASLTGSRVPTNAVWAKESDSRRYRKAP